MDSRDLFLSHSSGDAEIGRELRAELEAAGYSCWMAPDDVTGTDSWAEQILAAIEGCQAMIVLISTNANRSPHVSREVNLALGRRRPVLPIRIEDVAPEASLEYLLSLVQRIDAFPPPIGTHAPRIVRRLDSILRRTSAPISEPAVPSASTAPTEPLEALEPPPVAPPPVSVPVLDAPSPIPAGVLPAGSRVGAFTIEGVLGEGGMATVYRAIQDEPRRAVALKVIRADHARDGVYRQRFHAEKDTLAALEHPSIVPIYAAGEADGVLYLAMRLIDGPDLANRIQQGGRLTLAETIATLKPIAEAVDYAHASGVIHRDLKPSNIILDRAGRPYLTDFGLGKQLDKSHGLSAPGIALGTLAYMAPEQFSGLTDPELAGRIDVYAMGCVAYACLTGTPPFEADTPERLMYAHLHEPLPNRRELPDSVEAVLRRALAKAPSDRYATAAEFVAALTAAASMAAAHTAPVPIGGSRGGMGRAGAWARANTGLASGAAALGLILVLGTGYILGNPLGNEASPTPGASRQPDATQTVVDPGATSPSPSPTPAPSPSPSPPPTDPPTPSPPPPPTDPPTEPPTDRQPPTGVSVKANKSVVFQRDVNVTLGASGASQMRLGTAGSANGACDWNGWRTFARSGEIRVAGGTAGQRWVCAQFRDAAQNTSGVVRDSLIFDNKPVVHGAVYDYSSTGSGLSATCSTIKQYGGIGIDLIPSAASDKDGNGTLTVESVKAGGLDYTIVGDTVNLYFNPSSDFGRGVYTYNLVVVDEHGGRANGTFEVRIGPCPA